MNLQWKIFFLLFSIISLSVSSFAYGENKFKLKLGARGEICLTCHERFQEKLKSPYLHTPVESGECSECHNPHTSTHGMLLSAEPKAICYKCHEEVVPDKAVSTHKVVMEGGCVECHDPHAANNQNNLVKADKELCFDCHEGMGDQITKAKFKHSPVEKGCTNCHNPHGSDKSDDLLQDDVPALCIKCHKTDRPIFSKLHMNYPVGNGRCTTCHNPHGSNRAAILYDNVHRPVANKMCKQCHESSTSPTPFKTKRMGFELCLGCHNDMVKDTFNKNRVHWPLLDKKGCLNCHNAHASLLESLLKETTANLCGMCHSDTIRRQERVKAKHEPVMEGNCTTCHSAHASDGVLLIKARSVTELCQNCHDYKKHSTHPIGEKVMDPRNKKLSVTCLSCHKSHGTDYKRMIPFKTSTDLCVQCHTQYKR
jgi:DmsE family decaheme c-type cytochrome